MSLHYHHLRQLREDRYNAYYGAWVAFHKKDTLPEPIETFWPLPGDPGYKSPKEVEDETEAHIKLIKDETGIGPPEDN